MRADRWSWRCTTSWQGKVRSLDDLTKPEVKKIALANPVTAPYGKAGKQALERAGLWAKLEPKIVMAESVRQALLCSKGRRRGRLVGRAIANVPEVRQSRSTSSSTTRSSRHSASWRPRHGRLTPSVSRSSSWVRRDKRS